MTESMNLAFGANFDLLENNLNAVFKKDKDGSEILVAPTKIEKPASVKLEKIITELQETFGVSEAETQKMKDSLNSVKNEKSTLKIEEMDFQLQAAFLYKNAPATGTATTEYAFAINVDMSDALPSLGFIKLNSVFVAVWNTERQAVLRQIGTCDISKMLENLNA